MRDIGIRIQRYKLSRYRPAEAISDRARMLLTLGLSGWLIWALFVSDHSVVRLLALNTKKAQAETKLTAARVEVAKLEDELKSADDPEVGERVLRDRHNFARPGDLLYVIPGGAGDGGPAVVAPAPKPAPPAAMDGRADAKVGTKSSAGAAAKSGAKPAAKSSAKTTKAARR